MSLVRCTCIRDARLAVVVPDPACPALVTHVRTGK
jgi:hypothetical protein